MITIVDYGMGNLRSILMKFERLKFPARISRNSEEILSSEKLILPGVGHFAEGMKNIREFGLLDVLNTAALEKKVPVLGICLGMQLLTKYSEEGDVEGLGWIDGKTRKFDFSKLDASEKLRVPHVGWNLVDWKKDSPLSNGLDKEERFYFTHSFAVECEVESESIGVTQFGYSFSSVVQKENIYGTQFHPEKSHLNGLKLIENFCKL